MLTTTIDGLWVLQAVTGIDTLCPELGLRPLIPTLETPDRARQHPMAASLQAAGALDEHGNADPVIREWLTVISRRDLTLLVTMNVPGGSRSAAAICRFAQFWVCLERHDETIRLSAVGTSRDEESAQHLLVGQVERLCGVAEGAALRPVTVDGDRMLANVKDRATMHRFLREEGLDVDQLRVLAMVGDTERSAHASIVGIQAGVGDDEHARLSVGKSAVSIVDTAVGRVCMESIDNHGRRFQTVSSGTRAQIGAAVCRLIRKLPAGVDWHSYRRVV